MGVFEEMVIIDDKGTILRNKWIEWKHVFIGKSHCKTCLVLNNCWFNNMKMPVIPQHENCHCVINNIKAPEPNVSSRAVCPISKFSDYIFSEKYEWNGKRKLFELLGFTKSDSEYLKLEYENQALAQYCKSNYSLGKLDDKGQRINIDIKFQKNGRQIVFTSGWMVRPFGEITNNTPLAD